MNWTIIIPEVPPSRNSKEARERYRYAEVKARWKYTVTCLCKEQSIPPCTRIRTEPRIYFSDRRRRDHDNYGIVNKLVHDGLTCAGVIPGDDPRYLEKPTYPDLLLDREHPRTEITITSM